MKLTILGAAGVRSPLLVQGILDRNQALGLTELALMDIDAGHLEIIRQTTQAFINKDSTHSPRVTWTTDARKALQDADYVITTFRVGGIQSRVVDERVPLKYHILGQETTGPGGFAMAMRTIPVLFGYIDIMKEVCPNAWLINFANPAGLLAQAVHTSGQWPKTIGICDAPSTIRQVAAGLLHAPVESVYLDYFGLNHLGWVRSLKVNGRDYLPDFIAMLAAGQRLPGLPFSPALLQELQMIPNEYLYYFYSRVSAVENIISSGKTRGETILASNQELFAKLQELVIAGELDQIKLTYTQYLQDRGKTYMSIETGATEMDQGELSPEMISAMAQGGYVGVAMDVMEALNGSKPGVLLLNTPNLGAVQGFEPNDVLEIPAYVMPGTVQPLAVGKIPDHCIGLMKQVKKYEYLTIESAMDNSYQKALHALTVHPLVEDEAISVQILNDYIQAHGNLFPTLH